MTAPPDGLESIRRFDPAIRSKIGDEAMLRIIRIRTTAPGPYDTWEKPDQEAWDAYEAELKPLIQAQVRQNPPRDRIVDLGAGGPYEIRPQDQAHHEFRVPALEPFGAALSGALQVPIDIGFGIAHLAGLTDEAPFDVQGVLEATGAQWFQGKDLNEAYEESLQRRAKQWQEGGAFEYVKEGARIAGSIWGTFVGGPGAAAFRGATAGATALGAARAGEFAASWGAKAISSERVRRAASLLLTGGRGAGAVTAEAAGWGLLQGLQQYYDPETGELKDDTALERVGTVLTNAASWYAFNLALAAGRIGNKAVMHGADPLSASAIRRGLATITQAEAEAAGFTMLDFATAKDGIQAIIDGNTADWEKWRDLFLTSSIGINILKAGGAKNMYRFLREDVHPAPRDLRGETEVKPIPEGAAPADLVKAGWAERGDGKVRMPGDNKHWFREVPDGIEVSPELAAKTGLQPGINPREEALNAIDWATIRLGIRSRVHLPEGVEPDVDGSVVVEDPSDPTRMLRVSHRFDGNVARDVMGPGEVQATDIARDPATLAPAPPEQAEIGSWLRRWVAEQPVSDHAKVAIDNLGELLESISIESMPQNAEMFARIQDGTLKQIIDNTPPENLEPVLKALARGFTVNGTARTLDDMVSLAQQERKTDEEQEEPPAEAGREERPAGRPDDSARTPERESADEGAETKPVRPEEVGEAEHAKEAGEVRPQGEGEGQRSKPMGGVREVDRAEAAPTEEGQAQPTKEVEREPSIPLRRGSPEGSDEPLTTRRAILKQLEKMTQVPIRVGRLNAESMVAGTYSQFYDVIRLREAEDIAAGAHEVGHAIHRKFHNYDLKDMPEEARAELEALGRELYGEAEPTTSYEHEGWAEYVARRWLYHDVESQAPHFHEWFENTFLPKHKKLARQFRQSEELYDKWMRQMSDVGRARSRVVSEEKSVWERAGETLKALFSMRFWFDENYPVRKMIYKRLGFSKEFMESLPENINPPKMLDALKGAAPGTAEEFLLYNAVNLKNARTGKSLSQVVASVRDRLPDAFLYSWARHTLTQHPREVNGEMVLPDTGLPEHEAQAIIEKFGSQKMEDFATNLTAYYNSVLDYVGEAGGLPPEDIAAMREKNPFYIPLRRLFEETERASASAGGGGAVAGKSSPLVMLRRKGSARSVIDHFEQAIMQTWQYVHAANKVRAARSLADFADYVAERKAAGEDLPGAGELANRISDPTEVRRVGIDSIRGQLEKHGVDIPEGLEDFYLTLYSNLAYEPSKRQVVVVVRNGKPEFWEIPNKQVYEALTNIDPFSQDLMLSGLLRAPVAMVRAGAVGWNLTFWFRNLFRDPTTGAINTRHGSKMLALPEIAKDVLTGVPRRMAGKMSELERRLRASGAGMATIMGQARKPGLKTLKRIIAPKTKKEVVEDLATTGGLRTLLSSIPAGLAKWESALSVGEQLPRMREAREAYKAAAAKWGEDSEAAWIAAMLGYKEGTTNFTRIGVLARIMRNRWPIVFFNPALQGPLRMAKAIKENPFRSMGTAVAYVTAHEILNWWLQKDDDWYKNMDRNTLDRYWVWGFFGGKHILYIPKPFEWGPLFGSTVGSVAREQYKENPSGVAGETWDIFKQFSPIQHWVEAAPTAVQPILEVLTNKKGYRGGSPIDNPYEADNRRAWDLYDEWTTELAKLIGKLWPGEEGASPRKIEHLISAYTGGLGLEAVRAGETALGLRDPSEGLPVISSFIRKYRPTQSQVVQDFYDVLSSATHGHGSKDLSPMMESWYTRASRRARQWSDLRRRAKGTDMEDAVAERIVREARMLYDMYKRIPK